MALNPISAQTPPAPPAQRPQDAVAAKKPDAVAATKNDHDGDEVNGIDPSNEAQAASPAKPALGHTVNTTA
jgi:hypothetical protein